MAHMSHRQWQSGESGRTAEWIAAWWLRVQGWQILARRYGGKGGEIDLIARRGHTVIFVEVKARADLDEAAASLTPRKAVLIQRRIATWLATNPWARGHDLRADAIFLGRGRWPRHERAIFDLRDL